MSKLIRAKSFLKYAIALALAVGLAGCGTTSQPAQAPEPIIELGKVEHGAGYYLALARQARGKTRQSYLLQATRAHLIQGQLASAQQLLSTLTPQSLSSDDQQLEQQLLRSMLLAAQHNMPEAIKALRAQSNWLVTPPRWQSFYQQKSSLQLSNGAVIDAAISLMALAPQLTEPRRLGANQQQIWQLLSRVTSDELNDATSSVSHFDGWQALVLLTRHAAISPTKLQQALTQWTLYYPGHPAIENLPQQLIDAVNVTPYSPQKIALLLPLSGRYARLGKAVQDGIISNLLNRDLSPVFITLDTEKLGAQAAYAQAIANNAEFIIGPLLKKNVELISQQQSDVPILSLNKAPTTSAGNRRYYFSLDKESEAIQGSEYIFDSGKKSPAIIAPNNASGHKIAKLFAEHWQQLARENDRDVVVEQSFFDNDKNLKLTVEKLFETNLSQARINQVRLITGSQMKSETRSRRDIDSVYLVSNPQQTSMLKPSIDVTVSAFAPQVPVYVGSTGNEDHTQDRGANDLNQLHVSELPWLLRLRDTPLSAKKVKQLWPKLNQSQLRLFAMGYDAYQLMGYLAQMELFPQYKLEGFSGLLSLDDNNNIVREMSWAQYQRGRLIPQKH